MLELYLIIGLVVYIIVQFSDTLQDAEDDFVEELYLQLKLTNDDMSFDVANMIGIFVFRFMSVLLALVWPIVILYMFMREV